MCQKTEQTIILGIDPGTVKTGYGIVKVEGNHYSLLDCGCISPPAAFPLHERYCVIFDSISHILSLHSVGIMVVENQFVKKNIPSALKLSVAKGVAILAATKQRIPFFEYAPRQAKRAIVGRGDASKQQVQRMVRALFHLSQPIPEDAADALALAICHFHRMKGMVYKLC